MTKADIHKIQELRKKTGISISECKKILEESNNNIEDAIAELKKAGKKYSALQGEAKHGQISITKHSDKITMIQLNCQTDFVASTDSFNTALISISNLVAQQNTQTPVLDTNLIQEAISTITFEVKEAIVLVRAINCIYSNNTLVGSYSFQNSIGTIVRLSNTSNQELADNLAIHITAENPKYIDKLPQEVIDEITQQTQDQHSDKSPDIIQKIIDGVIKDTEQELCLIEQPYLKDTTLTIKEILSKENAQVEEFFRFQI